MPSGAYTPANDAPAATSRVPSGLTSSPWPKRRASSAPTSNHDPATGSQHSATNCRPSAVTAMLSTPTASPPSIDGSGDTNSS